MNQEKRLNKVQTSLTPKQAAILWLEEATKYQNLGEYVEFLIQKPQSIFPLHRLPEQVEGVVRDAMKGRPKDEVWAVMRRAVRDVAFLYHLALNTNAGAMSKEREWNLLRLALAHWLNGLILKHFHCKNQSEKDQIKNWTESVENSLVELYAYQHFADSVSRNYFDGCQVLFRDVADHLSSVTKRIEDQVELYNEIFADNHKRYKRINLEPLRDAAKKVPPESFNAIAQSKADALIFIGEREAAIKFVEKLL